MGLKSDDLKNNKGQGEEPIHPWFTQEFILKMLPSVLEVLTDKVKNGASEEDAIKAAKTVVKATLIAFISATKPTLKSS